MNLELVYNSKTLIYVFFVLFFLYLCQKNPVKNLEIGMSVSKGSVSVSK